MDNQLFIYCAISIRSKEETKMKLSERMKQVIKLKERGYSDQQIAEKFNVTRQAISQALQRARQAKYIWKNGEQVTQQPIPEPTETSKPETTKKPFPKYRCLKQKCRTPLTPLDEVRFKNGDEAREQLITKGYTHICLKCLRVYERSSTSPLEKGKCHECGSELYNTMKGEQLIGYYCPKCELLYGKDELEKARAKKEE